MNLYEALKRTRVIMFQHIRSFPNFELRSNLSRNPLEKLDRSTVWQCEQS